MRNKQCEKGAESRAHEPFENGLRPRPPAGTGDRTGFIHSLVFRSTKFDVGYLKRCSAPSSNCAAFENPIICPSMRQDVYRLK